MARRRAARCAILFVVALSAARGAAGAASAATGAGAPPRSIGGDVRDLDDRAPVPGARLRLQAPGDASPVVTTSDRAGNFDFPNVQDGRYRLIVDAGDYDEASFGVTIGGRAQPPLHVELRRRLRAIGATVTRANERARASSGVRIATSDLSAAAALRVARIALDYTYDVQSTVLDDLPNAVLATDSTLVNGAQAFGVPLHKATLGLEYATRCGLRARIEGHAVGPNNPQQLPGYAFADGSLSQTVSKRLTLNAAASNVLNSHAQTYGLVGLGIPYATNAYHAAVAQPFVHPFNERYGLAPASLTFSATLRI